MQRFGGVITFKDQMNIPYLCTSVAEALQRSPIPTMDRIIQMSVFYCGFNYY